MRLRLAAVLGPTHGRAIRLCRLDRPAQDEAERVPVERPLLLQHRASGGRGHVHHRHRISRRRGVDVRLGLPAFGVPVPRISGPHPRLEEPQAGDAKEAAMGKRDAFLQAALTLARYVGRKSAAYSAAKLSPADCAPLIRPTLWKSSGWRSARLHPILSLV